MKKRIFLFGIILILGCGNKQPQRVVFSVLKETGDLFYFNGKPYTGVAFKMWTEKQLKEEWSFKDGKNDGPFRNYYENGQLREEGSFKDGKLDGPFKAYYENGQLKEDRSYKDEIPDGIQKWYYENGQLKLEQNFKDGIQK